jgi:hypothetical protein
MRSQLTEEGLRELLRARYNNYKKGVQKFSDSINVESSEVCPKKIVFNDELSEYLYSLIARRLMLDKTDFQLIDESDFVAFIPSLIDQYVMANNEAISKEERMEIELVLRTMGREFIGVTNDGVLPGRNAYEEYWRWINIVLDLSGEHGIAPAELISFDWAQDEVCRRLYSKEELLQLGEATINKFSSPESIKRMLVEPMFEANPDFSEEEKAGFLAEIDEEVMPIVQKQLEEGSALALRQIKKEADRIYGVA